MDGTLDEMKAWVGYSDGDAQALAAVVEVIQPHVHRIIERFYDEVQRHPGSLAVLDGPEQVERLMRTLRGWLMEVFVGPHDETYAERRRAIGRRHVQVGLPDRYMFMAMHVVEVELTKVIRAEIPDPSPTLDSLSKVLAIDLALMTGTYVEGRERHQLDTLHTLLIEHLRVVVLLVGVDGRVRSATRATAQLSIGGDVLGRRWQDALPSGLCEGATLQRHVARALELHREVTLPRVDVDDRSFRVHIVPLEHDLADFLLQVEELTDAVEMEARLRRSEALAQLGALSTAVAHELRNPLAGISGALQVITRSMTEDTLHHQILTKVDGEVRRLNGLVTDLLAFARPGTAKVHPTALRPLVDEVIGMLQPEHPDVRMVVVGDGMARVDPHLIQQVLHNLVRNAVDAVEGRGRVRVVVAPARIDVQDDGPGVPEASRAEIFEPFVTTKTRGTGLGLAISARSAEAMGGDLGLGSGDLPGACFVLSLQPVV